MRPGKWPDTFGRKQCDPLQGVKEDTVLDELAKQLSAFANAGGGRIIYGIKDNGEVDNGGVALSVKGRQSTKDWLEDLIPALTEFEIIGCNVYPIEPKADGSKIQRGKALYIVDVPDSERAPHQPKRDLKYYVRMGGKSVPAPHRMIEDIRTRQRHPVMELKPIGLRVVSLPPFELRDPQIWEGDVHIGFRFDLQNAGRVMSRNTCLRIRSSMEMHVRTYDDGQDSWTISKGNLLGNL